MRVLFLQKGWAGSAVPEQGKPRVVVTPTRSHGPVLRLSRFMTAQDGGRSHQWLFGVLN